MTIGQGELFEYVVMYLLEERDKKTAGIELVAASRVKEGTDLAFGNASRTVNLAQVQQIEKRRQAKKEERSSKRSRTRPWTVN